MSHRAQQVSQDDVFEFVKRNPRIVLVDSPGSTVAVADAQLVPQIVGAGGSHILIPCTQLYSLKEMLIRIRIRSDKYNPSDSIHLERKIALGCAAKQQNLRHLLHTHGCALSMATHFQYFELVENLIPLNAILQHPNARKILDSDFMNREMVIWSFIKSLTISLEELQLLKAIMPPPEASIQANYDLAYLDMKPEQLLLDMHEETLRLCDFGSTRAVPSDPAMYVELGGVSTTMAFAPPEIKFGFVSCVTDTYMIAKTVLRVFGISDKPDVASALRLDPGSAIVALLDHMLQINQTDRATRARILEACGTVDTRLAARFFSDLYKNACVGPPTLPTSPEGSMLGVGPVAPALADWLARGSVGSTGIANSSPVVGEGQVDPENPPGDTAAVMKLNNKLGGREEVDANLLANVLAQSDGARPTMVQEYLRGLFQTKNQVEFERASGTFLLKALQQLLIKHNGNGNGTWINVDELSQKYHEVKLKYGGVDAQGRAHTKFDEDTMLALLIGKQELAVVYFGRIAYLMISQNARFGPLSSKNHSLLELNKKLTWHLHLLLATRLIDMQREGDPLGYTKQKPN